MRRRGAWCRAEPHRDAAAVAALVLHLLGAVPLVHAFPRDVTEHEPHTSRCASGPAAGCPARRPARRRRGGRRGRRRSTASRASRRGSSSSARARTRPAGPRSRRPPGSAAAARSRPAPAAAARRITVSRSASAGASARASDGWTSPRLACSRAVGSRPSSPQSGHRKCSKVMFCVGQPFHALERASRMKHVAAPKPDARLRLELVQAHVARFGPGRERRSMRGVGTHFSRRRV